MGSFGERLRREREMRGITLDEIAESTKISRRHLESLEKEDYDALPGGIFNRGFIRAYARYLGIDEEQAVADYTAASAEPAEPEPRFPVAVPEPDPQLNPRRSTLPLLLALLALVVVLAIFWARNRSHSENQEAASGTASASTASNAPPATRSPSPAPASAGASSASGAPSLVTSTGTLAPAAGTTSSSLNASSDPGGQSSPGATQTPERLFLVVIKAKEEAWVSLTADGKNVIARTLSAGEQESFRAGKRMVITTGNAGGVEISFNGKDLGAIGNESETRTLTFTPAGLVQ